MERNASTRTPTRPTVVHVAKCVLMAPRARMAPASSKPRIVARRPVRGSSTATSLMANVWKGVTRTSSVTPTLRVMSLATSAYATRGSMGAPVNASTRPRRNTAEIAASHAHHQPMVRGHATRMVPAASPAMPVITSAAIAAWPMIRSITAGIVASLAPPTPAGRRCVPRRGSARSSVTADFVTARARARRAPLTRRIQRARAARVSRRPVQAGRSFAMDSARHARQILARRS